MDTIAIRFAIDNTIHGLEYSRIAQSGLRKVAETIRSENNGLDRMLNLQLEQELARVNLAETYFRVALRTLLEADPFPRD